MSASRNLAGAAVLAVGCLSLPSPSVYACGPFFSAELFWDRAATLANLPDGVFVVEAQHLLPEPSDDFAVVEGGDEPPGARAGGSALETGLYQAGAAAWRQKHFGEARTKFLQVLALPASQRHRFSTFAAFMLGRGAGTAAEASRWFGQVRELARAQFADPLGLAVASYGEQARLQLRGDNDREAIRLYALQAAHGSESGAVSLLFVTRQIVADPQRLRRVLLDPLAQRLLASYAWTRGQESWFQGDREQRPPIPPLLEQLGSQASPAGADRLAAAAWRGGRFELAARFADKLQTPLALWVQSKLALRRGDRLSAERLLAQAIAGYLAEAGAPTKPRARPEGDDGSIATAQEFAVRAAGDAAVLALARGDFIGAMRKAAESCSYADAAYVAEQVLTTAELTQVLQKDGGALSRTCSARAETEPLSGKLRSLLARRLLRNAQHAQALAAFAGQPHADLAKQYASALDKARGSRDDIERAQALFVASKMARRHGLQLLGTETGPDWAIVAGEYDLESYPEARRYLVQASESPADRHDPPLANPLPAELRAGLLTSAEASRRSAHAPPHAQRFHYRETAADLAQAAARLVPPRSQAYYAMLCAAASYVSSTNPKRMQQLWTEYVRHGALLLNDDSVFGETCPEPDLVRARKMAEQAHAWHWPRWRKRTYAAAAAPVLILGFAAGLLLRRRKRS